MTVFERVKESVDITDAARRYGLQVDRRGKALCPFHDDTHPSLSFKGGGYTCFACGARGDVISLVGRLTGAARPIEAVRTLNADYGLGLDIGGKIDRTAARKWARERARLEAFREWMREACIAWAAYCRMLEAWKYNFAPKSPEEKPDPRFMEALSKLDHADYIYRAVFIDGCNNMEVQTIFYRDYRREVERIASLDQGCCLAG